MRKGRATGSRANANADGKMNERHDGLKGVQRGSGGKGACASSNYGRCSGIICLRIVAAKHCCAAKRSTRSAIVPQPPASLHPLLCRLRPFVRPSYGFKRIVPLQAGFQHRAYTLHHPLDDSVRRMCVHVCVHACPRGAGIPSARVRRRCNFGNLPDSVFSATAN